MSCAVISCNNYKSRRPAGVSFHRFPRTKNMLDRWIRSLGLPDDWTWTANKYVCSNHFNEEDFFNNQFQSGRKILKITAIPSLLIYKKKNEIHETIVTDNRIHYEPDRHYAQLDLAAIDDEEIQDETVQESGKNLEGPLGEKFLRVCRICMTVHKKEDTIPLLLHGSMGMTGLYNKLREFLQIELYPVDDSCLCKNCEKFIEEIFNFLYSCRNNEKTLTTFDWTNKTKNLLHIINQGKLARLCTEIKIPVIKQEIIQDIPKRENFGKFEQIEVKMETNWDENEGDENAGNGLSDMEDHWYYADDIEEKSYEFPRKLPENCYTYRLPNEDDLFSLAFDKYFNAIGNRASVRLITKCGKYHVSQYGDPPYLCEKCGELKYSKTSLSKHIKNHLDDKKFQHTKSLECLFCHRKFAYQKYLSLHLETHKNVRNDNLCRFYGIKNKNIRKINGKVRKFFKCNKCSRRYPKIRSLILHKKHCRSEETAEISHKDLILENYDLFIDDQGNTKLVILENNAKFFKEFKYGTICLE